MNSPSLIDYYSQRAREYERIYHKPERQDDLERLRTHLRAQLNGRRVLEVACGTAYWTAVIADAVDSVWATDASDEVLEVARAKSLDPIRVTFANADAYHPRLSRCDFDAGLAAFWWSHVPKAKLSAFLDAFHAELQPGARVVFMDNRYVPGSSTPISRADSEGNTFQQRRLDDGSTHEVLKNFPSLDELHRVLAPYADDLDVTTFDYFWSASYELRTS